ncbi:hypothetical protein CANINC_002137 [Pichia inconspicua]|uniref:Ketopantoate reductase C-terminal domain-containing protein n=1 Tax=Pichia inconspicua TaxID=52247 RepID=A0A4T0X239_9ASCO|nr:hypothetical protein CANINC_002137 [[Candida] inconspicua]
MSTNNIIPLSAAARFLATQLSSVIARPQVVLPPHLLKPFLTAESKITYINKISPNNTFTRSHSFPCSSIKFLERASRPIGGNSDSNLNGESTPNPFSLILPASQLTLLLDPNSQDSALLPPPNSIIVIVNPYYGQIEKFMSRFTNNYLSNERPKIWTAVCTHNLTNGPSWSVEHRSIGEVKLAHVPFEDSNPAVDMNKMIDESNVIKDILNTPPLLPQIETYDQINQLLIDQLITEAALTPLLHHSFKDIDICSDENFKDLSYKIIEEAVEAINQDKLFIKFCSKNAAFKSILSTKRLFHKTRNVLKNNDNIIRMFANLDADEDILKMRERNKHEYERMIDGDRDVKISRIRDPVKANRYIKKLGSKNGLRTPANSHVVTLLTSDYYTTENNSPIHN